MRDEGWVSQAVISHPSSLIRHLLRDVQYVIHTVEAGWIAGQKLRGGQRAVRVTIAVGGFDGDFERFAEQPEDDRVLARVVAAADRVIANLAVGPGTDSSLAAVTSGLLLHHARNELAKFKRGAAGSVFLVAVMPL